MNRLELVDSYGHSVVVRPLDGQLRLNFKDHLRQYQKARQAGKVMPGSAA